MPHYHMPHYMPHYHMAHYHMPHYMAHYMAHYMPHYMPQYMPHYQHRALYASGLPRASAHTHMAHAARRRGARPSPTKSAGGLMRAQEAGRAQRRKGAAAGGRTTGSSCSPCFPRAPAALLRPHSQFKSQTQAPRPTCASKHANTRRGRQRDRQREGPDAEETRCVNRVGLPTSQARG